jgi:hypothetical protein
MLNKIEILSFFRTFWRLLRALIVLFLATMILAQSILPYGGLSSQVRSITRAIEFDFGTWTLDAIVEKFSNWALSLQLFIPQEQQSNLVMEYLSQVERYNLLNAQVLLIFADPEIPNPNAASLSLRLERDQVAQRLKGLAPLAESILQTQLMSVINDVDLGILGQVLPPSLYRTSEIPYSLVVSPRTEIKQAFDISLEPGLVTETMERIERQVFNNLDYAALVVPIGGIGTYPTMIMQTTNIVWLTEVIAHEWVHNYLTVRPLGMNYLTSAELRTLNETVASLAGKELGRMILERYYPDFLPPDVEAAKGNASLSQPEPDPNAFDFRKEMRITRIEVDQLLAQGEVQNAEEYMESRRQFFWENGYLIRKLNQAYFAFYGAYNDEPGGGASGEDPIGPAVVAYREQFDSLGGFLNAISWIDSFDDLQKRLNR